MQLWCQSLCKTILVWVQVFLYRNSTWSLAGEKIKVQEKGFLCNCIQLGEKESWVKVEKMAYLTQILNILTLSYYLS